MGKLSNKVALVTGAGSGLGRGIALTYAKEGATVVLTGRREEKLREVEKEIGDTEGKAIVIPTDFTNEEEVKSLREKLNKETDGKLDIFVANAGGVNAMGKATDMTVEQWQGMFDLNATTQFLSAKHFLPMLRESDHGKFISVTSGMVNFYMEGMSAYSAMKAAAEMFIRTVAEEEKETGVQVNMYDPLNAISEGNPDGAHDPMDIVDVLVDLAAAETVEKHGEIIKPDVE